MIGEQILTVKILPCTGGGNIFQVILPKNDTGMKFSLTINEKEAASDNLQSEKAIV